MIDSRRNELARAQTRCFPPSGGFVEFGMEATEQSVCARFQQQVEKFPERWAVLTRDQQRTYRELNQSANRIARAILQRLGPEPEPVALLLEHGVAAIDTIMGVLKAGKIYLPLDPFSPDERSSFMLDDAQVRLGITNERHMPQARQLTLGGIDWLNHDTSGAGLSDDNPDLLLSPDRLASLYYTSGSTGRPKGVGENHRNRLVNAMRNTNTLRICPEDRLSLLYHHAFSGSVNCLFGALLNGATLLPFDLKAEGMASLAQGLAREEITIYHSTPPIFRHLVASLPGDATFPHLRILMLASDSLYEQDVKLYREHFSEPCLLLNSWGATESPFFRPFFIDHGTRLGAGNVPAIGPPTGEEEILLLDEDGAEVGVNQVGEIVIRSRYLSPGYYRNPQLTMARFRDDPAGRGRRRYHTGDLGRRLADGSIVHLGRKDFQVKVRGYRIELSEIEIALLNLDPVKEAVVLGWPEPSGDRRLVAYLVPASLPAPSAGELRRALAVTLPDYMIPSAYVWLDDLPRTPNGKVNRPLLPEPGRERPSLENGYVAPRNLNEAILAGIWAEVLDLEAVGVEDHFLDLGGNSLLATQVISRMRTRLRIDLPVRALFEAPTVAELALQVSQHQEPLPDDDELEQALALLEAMSDKEARRLLAHPDEGNS